MNISYLISGIIGLLTGTIASLVAPWINWRLERKKTEREEKQKLIANLRLYVLKNDPKNSEFMNSIEYIRIRPYLSELFVRELENTKEVVVLTNSIRSKYQSDLLEQIDRIEEDWNLKISNKKITNKKYENNSGKYRITVTHK